MTNPEDAQIKIFIAGKLQADELLNQVNLRAASLRNDPRHQIRSGALDEDLMGSVSDTRAFDRCFLARLRDKSQVDTQPFEFPRKPGITGLIMVKIRSFLWKLLRYQHDRMSSRQNRVNAWIISALERQAASLTKEVEDLRLRISRMDNATTSKDSNRTPSE